MEAEAIVAQLLHGGEHKSASVPEPAVVGKRTVRATAASDIPTSLDELFVQISHTYDLSLTAAAEASIPVVGSVSGGASRRVVVLERLVYKPVQEALGTTFYGYAIRLGVTVNKLEASTKITLPFLAASAEVGAIEAKWALQVVGLAGDKIDSGAIPPTELNVETFVLAKQSLTALIGAVRDSTTRFTAQKVGTSRTADELDREYRTGIARAYALGRLERGRKLRDAVADLPFGKTELRDYITDFYRDFAGISDPQQEPPSAVRTRAQALLGGVKVEPR
jgi:hypothetical protein